MIGSASQAPAQTATTTWTDGTGSWFAGQNWSNGVPASGTDATVSNGGISQVDSGGIGRANTLTIGNTSGTEIINNSTLVIGSTSGGGTITIDRGTLQSAQGSGTSPSISNAIQIGALGGTINSNGADLFLNGAIAGVGVLTLTKGAATVTGESDFFLDASSTFAGGAIVSHAHVTDAATNAIGVGALEVDAGSDFDLASFNQTVTALTGGGDVFATGDFGSTTGTNLATLTVSSGSFSGRLFDGTGQLTFNGVTTNYAGVLALKKVSAGTLTLTGGANYSGGTDIEAGTVTIGNSSVLGSGPVALSGGASLQATANAGGMTIMNAITIGPGGGTLDSNGNHYIEFTGPITPVGNGGVLTLTSSIDDVTTNGSRQIDLVLSGGNSNAAGTTVSGVSNIIANADNALGSGSLDVEANAWVEIGGSHTQAVTDLTGSGVIFADGFRSSTGSGTATLTVESGTYSGFLGDGTSQDGSNNFSGTLALTKTTSGTLTLTGRGSDYSGGTQLQAGIIAVSNYDPLGTGVVAMSNGTTIRTLAGTTLTNDFTLSGSDTFDMSGTGNPASPYTGGMKITGDISGTGELVKTGSLGLQLDGDNSYQGGTLVEAGHVGVGNDNAFGTGPVTFDGGFLVVHSDGHTISNTTTFDQATTFDTRDMTLTYAGVISGPGGLTKVGSGTLYVTAADTYGGGTQVQDGTFILGNGSHAGSIVGDVAMTNGTFGFNEPTAAQPYVIAGVISGSGRVYQFGPGTVELTGNNSYTGPTNIENGTLIVGSATALGSASPVYVPASGTLSVNGFAPTIGALNDYGNGQSNGGTVLLQGGTLTIGAGDQNSAFSGAIADGTVPGGKLVKIGAGTLALNGTDSFRGGFTVHGGTLSIGSDAALGSGPLSFDSGTTLAFTANGLDIGNDVAFPQVGDPTIDTGPNFVTMSGTISGPGNLEKLGTGTLDLTGTNTYTGTTAVEQGTLLVDGSIVSTATVDSGAVLGGGGTVGGFHVLAGGTLAPGIGRPFSTLKVAGSATFDAGSTYRVNINAAGQSDAVAISGTATLNGGTVAVVAAAGGSYSPANRYTILTASGGRTGAFSRATLSSNLAFLTPVLNYGANDVVLGFAQTAGFASAGTTPNQRAVAGAVQSLGPGNPVYDALLGQTPAGAQQALQSLSGQAHASTHDVAVGGAHFASRAVFDRFWNIPIDGGGDAVSALDQFGSTTTPAALRCYTPQEVGPGGGSTPANYTVWGQAVGDFDRLLGDGNAATVSSTLGGFALGIDSKVDAKPFDNWRVGLSGGYTSDNFAVAGGNGSGTFESVFGTLYGGARYGAVDVRLGGSYGGTSTRTARTVAFPGFVEAEHANYGGSVAQGFGELGYRVAFPQTVLEPIVGAGITHVHEDRYREKGGPAALVGFAQDTDVGTTTLGFRTEVTPFDQVPLVARVFLGWQHSYGDLNPAATQAFLSGSAAFSTYGIPLDRDAAVAETAVEYRASDAVKLSLAYSGQIGRRDRDNSVRGRAEYRF